jgi:hypothetical protein
VRRRRALSSESGLIGVWAVIGLALAALVIYLLLAAFKSDPAYFGTVPIPSQGAPVELKSGEVEVSYVEQVQDAAAIERPNDLSYTVRTPEGEVLQGQVETREPETSDVGPSLLVGTIDAPEDGTYLVDADAGPNLLQPELAFGLRPTGVVRVKFNEVVDELNGPTGILVLVGLGVLFLIPRVRRAIKRLGDDRSADL